MPEIGFKYSASRPITKNKERIQKFKETGHSRYIYQNKRDKACFQHDMAAENINALPRIRLLIKKYFMIKQLM